MAQSVTLEGLRGQIVKSLYGKKLGLSFGTPGSTLSVAKEIESDYLVGIKGVRQPFVVTLTSATTATSTADQIPNYGVVLLNTTTWASTGFNTVSPIPGVGVQLLNLSSAHHDIWFNNSTATTGVIAVIQGSSDSGGTTAGTHFVLNANAWADLVGLTTASWFVKTVMGSSVTTGSSQSSAR